MSIVASAATIILVSPWIVTRKQKQNGKETLLLRMLKTWLTPADPDYQAVVASIPIVYARNNAVLEKRSDWLEHANSEPERLNAGDEGMKLQADLIQSMAEAAGHALYADDLLKGAYISDGFAKREYLAIQAAEAQARIASALEQSLE
ncbi:DUF6680 family protein [Primorskyibacter sp. 2E107]|uniref:DUF6680 family protein n=1 Tax=Primorskyibacter sp. 2E107 TaxID=3403458 RepID=UPI003AF61A52